MMLVLVRKDVEAVRLMCIWNLDRLASVELYALPQSPRLSLSPRRPRLALPLQARARQTTVMCLDRLLRSRLAFVPLPLLRQSESESKLYSKFHEE